MNKQVHGPIVLLILDGWGLAQPGQKANAIEMAAPKTYQSLIKHYPQAILDPHGTAVGLPDGQMGNSEVGHLNMGAGRVVYQELTRIDHDIETGAFFENHVLLNTIQHAKQHDSTLHLMGLVSDGGVHSQLNHLLALIKLAKQAGLQKLKVHAFLDGRDTPPQSAWSYLEVVEKALLDNEYDQIATICGRYYAMDRDKRWERTQLAYDMLTQAKGNRFLFSQDALTSSYNQNIHDEFVEPAICDIAFEGIQDNDACLFFNFRPDRARQMTDAFISKDFSGFARERHPQNVMFTIFGPYDASFDTPVVFPREDLKDVLADVLSKNNIKQYRVAETEKYAHVTYFFNGGQEKAFDGEDRCLVPSPKVATYDLQPEMSLPQVANNLVAAINSGKYEVLICNVANPDMVGHTGNIDAAVQAVKAVDTAIEAISQAVLSQNGLLFITADHGNLEMMQDAEGKPHTSHTTNPVPFIAVSDKTPIVFNDAFPFALCHISPTILDLLGLDKPATMTAPSMLKAMAIK